jgi:hypothetical protein
MIVFVIFVHVYTQWMCFALFLSLMYCAHIDRHTNAHINKHLDRHTNTHINTHIDRHTNTILTHILINISMHILMQCILVEFIKHTNV